MKHLEYDDLHVTQGIREEGLRGGGNRGGRGLDMSDARYDTRVPVQQCYHTAVSGYLSIRCPETSKQAEPDDLSSVLSQTRNSLFQAWNSACVVARRYEY